MTDPLVLSVTAFALVIAVWAAILHRPPSPGLDAARLFAAAEATLLRGRAESRGETAEQWESAVQRYVLFEGPPSGDVRLQDPAELGPKVDPERLLGGEASWDSLAAWGADSGPMAQLLTTRVGVRWLLIRGQRRIGPDLLAALALELGPRHSAMVLHGDTFSAGREGVARFLEGVHHESPSSRHVIVAEAEAIGPTLEALLENPSLRDAVLAVVSVGGFIRGLPHDTGEAGRTTRGAWLAEHFGHASLDTEVSRPTLYASLRWGLPSGEPGSELPDDTMRFPDPVDAPGPSRMEPVDLGAVPVLPDLPLPIIARALEATVELWIAAHR
jgi:hypothetical protein